MKLKTARILLLLAPIFVHAEDAKPEPKKITVRAPSSILNFDGDLIEGERKKPDLFYETAVQDLSLDSILYLRKDFNDFHAVDSKRRPRHFRQRSSVQ